MIERPMSALKQTLKRVPLLRETYHHIDLFRRYGSLFPEQVKLEGSAQSIFVNPREARGRALLRNHASGQPTLKALWRAALEHLHPTIVLDVGVNYGEFLFLTTYSQDTRIIGIEANPLLESYLERSRAKHPNGDRIELVYALAGSQSDEALPFWVNPAWSGSSSALEPPKTEQRKKHLVKTLRLDDLFKNTPLNEQRLLFKIDVEGYEAQVVSGMTRLFSECTNMVGLIEFNLSALKRAQVDIDAYCRTLQETFTIFRVEHDGHIERCSLDDYRQMRGYPQVETDLLVFSPQSADLAKKMIR